MRGQRLSGDLSVLYRILEAGEKGYAVSAANVSNRGLKAALKSYARQRAGFKSEVLMALQRLAGHARTRPSVRGFLHRGRITIFAALTIGSDEREQVVLKEVLIGERAALRTYEKILKGGMPDPLREVLTRQYFEVRAAYDQIHLLRGREGKRLILRLFDSGHAAESAAQELGKAGFDTQAIEQLDFNEVFSAYDGNYPAVAETTASGAVGGAFWGSLVGTLAGAGLDAANLSSFGLMAGENLWAWIALAGIGAGALVGALLGFAIGLGIHGEDAYLYDQSLRRGKIVLKARVDALRAKEASRIMSDASARGRARTVPA